MIIWLIGLSGSGKTTLARALKIELEKHGEKTILIDGDKVRAYYKNDLGFSNADRRKNAERIINICKTLDKENVTIIAAILHNFPDQRKLNRYEFKNYLEVYIKSKKNTLIKRDTKKIYKRFKEKKIKNVVGLDIKFEEPTHPDIIIKAEDSIKKNLRIILKKKTKIKDYIFDKLNPQEDKLYYTYAQVDQRFLNSYNANRENFIRKYQPNRNEKFLFSFTKNDYRVEKSYRYFEINRKLINQSGKEMSLDEYINVSLKFSLYLKKRKSYKVLNCFLKLNDFILYKCKKKGNVELKKKFSKSLIFEKKLISNIYNEKKF